MASGDSASSNLDDLDVQALKSRIENLSRELSQWESEFSQNSSVSQQQALMYREELSRLRSLYEFQRSGIRDAPSPEYPSRLLPSAAFAFAPSPHHPASSVVPHDSWPPMRSSYEINPLSGLEIPSLPSIPQTHTVPPAFQNRRSISASVPIGGGGGFVDHHPAAYAASFYTPAASSHSPLLDQSSFLQRPQTPPGIAMQDLERGPSATATANANANALAAPPTPPQSPPKTPVVVVPRTDAESQTEVMSLRRDFVVRTADEEAQFQERIQREWSEREQEWRQENEGLQQRVEQLEREVEVRERNRADLESRIQQEVQDATRLLQEQSQECRKWKSEYEMLKKQTDMKLIDIEDVRRVRREFEDLLRRKNDEAEKGQTEIQRLNQELSAMGDKLSEGHQTHQQELDRLKLEVMRWKEKYERYALIDGVQSDVSLSTELAYSTPQEMLRRLQSGGGPTEPKRPSSLNSSSLSVHPEASFVGNLSFAGTRSAPNQSQTLLVEDQEFWRMRFKKMREDFEAKLRKKQDELERATLENGKYRMHVEAMKRERTTLISRQELENVKRQFEGVWKEKLEEIAVLETALNDLRSQLDEEQTKLKDCSNQLEDAHKEKQASIEAMDRQHEKDEEEKKSLRVEIDHLRTRISQLEEDVKRWQDISTATVPSIMELVDIVKKSSQNNANGPFPPASSGDDDDDSPSAAMLSSSPQDAPSALSAAQPSDGRNANDDRRRELTPAITTASTASAARSGQPSSAPSRPPSASAGSQLSGSIGRSTSTGPSSVYHTREFEAGMEYARYLSHKGLLTDSDQGGQSAAGTAAAAHGSPDRSSLRPSYPAVPSVAGTADQSGDGEDSIAGGDLQNGSPVVVEPGTGADESSSLRPGKIMEEVRQLERMVAALRQRRQVVMRTVNAATPSASGLANHQPSHHFQHTQHPLQSSQQGGSGLRFGGAAGSAPAPHIPISLNSFDLLPSSVSSMSSSSSSAGGSPSMIGSAMDSPLLSRSYSYGGGITADRNESSQSARHAGFSRGGGGSLLARDETPSGSGFQTDDDGTPVIPITLQALQNSGGGSGSGENPDGSSNGRPASRRNSAHVRNTVSAMWNILSDMKSALNT